MNTKDKNDASTLSRFAMERFLNGDCTHDEMRAMENRIAASLEAKRYIEKTRNASARFSNEYPTFAALDKQVAGRRQATPHQSALQAFRAAIDWRQVSGGVFRSAPVFVPLTLAVVAVFFGYRLMYHPVDTAFKGGNTPFLLYVNGQNKTPADTVFCKPGDTIQLSIQNDVPLYYSVWYRDNGGEIRSYLASTDTRQLKPVGSPRSEPVSNSIILENGWQYEELICLWARKPITANQIKGFVKEYSGEKNQPGLNSRVFFLFNTAD